MPAPAIPAGEEAPGQVDRWIGSIGAAADYLRQAAGVAEIGLRGFRLGAVLAVEAARRRGDIAMLGLLAPILSGRRHARELTLAAALQDKGGQAEWLEIQGYPLHRSDLARLRELEPRLGAGAAPRVLLLAAEQPAGPLDGDVEIRLFLELAGLCKRLKPLPIRRRRSGRWSKASVAAPRLDKRSPRSAQRRCRWRTASLSGRSVSVRRIAASACSAARPGWCRTGAC